MDPNYLDFEQEIADFDQRIRALRGSTDTQAGVNVIEEVKQLEQKRQQALESIFSKLTSWQVCQLARHPMRPHTVDYIERIFTDFEPLHGDRMYADDTAIVAGLAKLGSRSVMVIGHEKGRDTKDKLRCNFGMPRPEGYRKAQRLARMAERFHLPVVTFIDTPGAYPGIDAEARGQSEAIAQSLMLFSGLRTPVVSLVIGEGGSGGALAIGVGDHLAMLEHSIYSVISPEGCASILWKSAERAAEAAEAMGVTAPKLLELGLIDELIEEPLGGAQRDPAATAERIAEMLTGQLERLSGEPIDQLLEARYRRLRLYGAA